MKKEIMNIEVFISSAEKVASDDSEALMLFFSGQTTGEYFTGSILPGAIDTQQKRKGEERSLSARYILEGKDYQGMKCRIFIENNGIIKEGESTIKTTPEIITDSPNLKWFETAELMGEVIPSEKGVLVRIYQVLNK